MKSKKRCQKNGAVIRTGTIASYVALQKNLELFSEKTGKTLRIKDIDDIRTKRESISERNYWNRFYLEFTEFLYDRADDNYVGTQIKLLRAFFNYQNYKLDPAPGDWYKRFYVIDEEIPVLVLYPERLKFLIFNKEFENRLPKHLKKHKDMFVFGCTTALRFSDLSTLTPQNIERINKNVYVTVRSQKTGIFSRVYLPDYAKSILEKYKRRKKSLFPPISLVNFNIAIKQITFRAGWTEELEKTRNKRGIPFKHFKDEKTKANHRFCDLISSHCMRRTAITTMLRFGMNELNVRTISGHKANIVSFHRYISYSDSFMDEQMEAFYAKLQSAE